MPKSSDMPNIQCRLESELGGRIEQRFEHSYLKKAYRARRKINNNKSILRHCLFIHYAKKFFGDLLCQVLFRTLGIGQSRQMYSSHGAYIVIRGWRREIINKWYIW